MSKEKNMKILNIKENYKLKILFTFQLRSYRLYSKYKLNLI